MTLSGYLLHRRVASGSHRIIELEKMETVSNFKIWIWGKCKERGTGGAHDGWDGKGLVAKHSQRAAGIQNKSRQTRVWREK